MSQSVSQFAALSSPVTDECEEGRSQAMDLSEAERAMFDALVLEEMAKLDAQVREQAMMGLSLHKGSKQSSSHHLIPELPENPSQFLPRQSSAVAASLKGGRRPVQEPQISSSEQKALSAPVTVLMAKRQPRPNPSNEGEYVHPTILSGIGATGRKNERQKVAKRDEFMRAVAEDEAKRRELRRNNDGDTRALPGIMSKEEREQVLKRWLEPLRPDFDYILIDTPPSLNLLTLNALVAANEVLVPVQAEFFSLLGHELHEVRQDLVGGLANPEVIVASVEKNGAGLIWLNDLVELEFYIGHMGAAKTAIDGRMWRHVLGQGAPEPDRG
jgi:hypothetical protein